VKARSNLSETAFFYPHLTADRNGVVTISFKAPEALTRWRLLGFAHDRGLRSGSLEAEAVTQKEIMVQPLPPRFLREGDRLELTVKVTNRTDAEQSGAVELRLFDPLSEASLDADLANGSPRRSFTVPARQSRAFSWPIAVPDGLAAVGYRAVYAFDDIRKVRIGRDRSRPGAERDKTAEPAEGVDDAITFGFAGAAAGAPALLTIRLPEKKADGKAEKVTPPDAGKKEDAPPEPMDPKSLEMMQALFKGMRMSVSVRIEGAIAETNATWRRDADITLMDMDFERILGNRDLLLRMETAKPDSFADMKALFHQVEGLKFELNNPVFVRFQ
jgi:hypothetical protein